MPSNPVKITFGQQFVKDLKHLRKKYPTIRSDVDSIIARLQNGETPDDHVQGTGYTLYKARLKSSDLAKGKSGGYRIIYFIQTQAEIGLITIYVKSEYTDLGKELLKQLVEEYLKSK